MIRPASVTIHRHTYVITQYNTLRRTCKGFVIQIHDIRQRLSKDHKAVLFGNSCRGCSILFLQRALTQPYS